MMIGQHEHANTLLIAAEVLSVEKMLPIGTRICHIRS